jgi:hypothetical protein
MDFLAVEFICLGYDKGTTLPWNARINLTIHAMSYPKITESWSFYSRRVTLIFITLCILCINDNWFLGEKGGGWVQKWLWDSKLKSVICFKSSDSYEIWETIVMLQDHVTVWSVLGVPPCAKPESFIVWPTNHIVTFSSACSIGGVLYFVRLWLLLLLVWLTSWMGSKITAQHGIINQLVQRDLCQIGEIVLFSLYCSIFQPVVLSDDN